MADCPQHTINQATGHKLDHRTRNGVVPVIVNIDVHRFGQTGDQHGDIEKKNKNKYIDQSYVVKIKKG